MVSLSGEDRQINGLNGHAEEEYDDLEGFDQPDDGEVQADSFFSQNPFSQQLAEKRVAGVHDV